MIFLITDFGADDIYVGQAKAALLRHNSTAQFVDLLHDVPNFNAQAGAHLLAALAEWNLSVGDVMLAVVDAGVGGSRQPVVLQVDGRWYVGPDNGQLSVLAARATSSQVWQIIWRPQALSNSFHGRDLFAPVAALLAAQKLPEQWLKSVPKLEITFGAADLLQVIYVDHYGNAITGLRANQISERDQVKIGGRVLRYTRVFSEARPKEAFWYVNSIGLVEVAINCGNAARQLSLTIGDELSVINA